MRPGDTLKQPFPYSLPKDKIKILLLEGISETAVGLFKAAAYSQIDRRTKALDAAELREALDGGVRMLGIRSRTQLTADAIEGVRSLVAVGCFSVGTNQVDLAACRAMGIPVFNAPFSNTRSVAELTIAEIVMLMRRIFPKSDRRAYRRLGQERRRLQRGARQDARHRRLRQHRHPARRAGRGHGHAGPLLRPRRQVAPRQRRAHRDAGRPARRRRRGQPARPRDAGHPGHDRRG